MDVKRFSVGTIVGAVVLFATGWVIFNYLFADWYAANTGSATGVDRAPEAQIMWAFVVGAVAYAAAITYALGRGSAQWSIGEGAKVGAVVGFLIWATADLSLYGFSNIANLNRTLVDPLLELVHGALGGAAIGMTGGMMRKG